VHIATASLSHQGLTEVLVFCDNLYAADPDLQFQTERAAKLVEFLVLSLARQEYKQREENAKWKELSGRAAHRLANVLLSANTPLELYLKGHQGDPRATIERAHARVRDAREIIAGLQEFAIQREVNPNQQIKVGDLVERLADDLRKTLPPGAAAIKTDSGERDSTILVDYARLREEFAALADNSRKHSQKRPDELEITIGADAVENRSDLGAGPYVRLFFADNGCGVSAAKAPYLFMPYYTTSGTSLGLGLAITKEIIEKHAGAIELAAGTHSGARFNIYLPVIQGGTGHE